MKHILLAVMPFMLMAMSQMDDIFARVQDGDLAGGFKLSQQLSANGEPDGDEALGWFYEEGETVPVDKAKAADHYRRAAEKGLKHSQWKLGILLDTGDGVKEDPVEALSWIRKSADQDYGFAHASMGVMHAMGCGTPVDYTKSMASYRRAATLKNSGGFYGIGVLYALGQGVEKNEEEAAAWFLVAAALGDSRAEKILRENFDFGDEQVAQKITNRANQIFSEFGLQAQDDQK